MTGSGSSERGAALLVVIGALSALAVPTALLLFAVAIAYESEGYTRESTQARLLVEAARRQLEAAVAAGVLAPPPGSAPVVLRNGIDGDGRDTGIGRFPIPEAAGDWPPLTDRPPHGPDPSFGIGSALTFSPVLGPRGDRRGPAGPAALSPDDGVLLDLEVRVWFRRAVAERRWRYLFAGGALRRLDRGR